MKVLFINPMVREWAKPNCVPLGLGYLGAMLENAGHEVEVLDINATRITEDQVRAHIQASDYGLVGVGGMVTVYGEIKKLIGICKEMHPDRPVAVGGSSATSMPRTTMERSGADILCIGEGEHTMVAVADALDAGESLAGVEGIWFKEADGTIRVNPPRPMIMDLDEIPFPDYSLFPMDIYLRNPIGWLNVNKWADGDADSDMLSVNLLSSRGCVFNCIYCYHDFMGCKYRKRSPENIVAEIEMLMAEYGARYFHFVDDNFVTYRKNVFTFCDIIKKKGLDIYWGCSGRINSMDEDLILAMKDAGCTFITYGIESGSQRMLDAMKKNVKVEDVKRVLRLTMKHIGEPSCTFIVGTPGETRETIQETIDFCRDVQLTPEAIFFMTPYPGTELYDIALKRGVLSMETEEEFVLSLGEQGEDLRVNFSTLPDQELIDLKWKMAEDLKAQNLKKHVLQEGRDIRPGLVGVGE